MKNRVFSKIAVSACFCFLVAAALHAEVSDDVWKALIDKNVVIEKNDGSEVAGKLTSVGDQVVVVIKTDGKVVSVAKRDAQGVRVTETAAVAAAEDMPVRALYAQFDPLGFLQIGPCLEFGVRLTPSTLLGLGARFEGLGLLYQDIATSGFQNNASLLCMGIEAMAYQLFPTGGRNRWYLQALFGYGWGSTYGTDWYYGDWHGDNSHLEVAAGGGYRWRFPSGFFVDVGAVAGIGIGLSDSWYYTSTPSKTYTNTLKDYFIGAVQVHLGREL